MLNHIQLELLLSTMEEEPRFAKNQITEMGWHGHYKFKVDWNKLFKQLNELGRTHTLQYYKSHWEKLKSEARQTMAEYLQVNALTGNKNNPINLSETTERICAIFGKYGTGQPVLPEVGVKEPKNRMNAIDGFDVFYKEKGNVSDCRFYEEEGRLEELEPVQFFQNYNHDMILLDHKESLGLENEAQLIQSNLHMQVISPETEAKEKGMNKISNQLMLDTSHFKDDLENNFLSGVAGIIGKYSQSSTLK